MRRLSKSETDALLARQARTEKALERFIEIGDQIIKDIHMPPYLKRDVADWFENAQRWKEHGDVCWKEDK